MSDELFNAATDYLVNGADLPDEVADDKRFVFLSAMLKDIHGCTKKNTERINKNEKRLDKYVNWLKGLASVATILSILAKLGVV